MHKNGWYKNGSFWGYVQNNIVRQLCYTLKEGVLVMAPRGNTLAIGFLFLGSISEYQKQLMVKKGNGSDQ